MLIFRRWTIFHHHFIFLFIWFIKGPFWCLDHVLRIRRGLKKIMVFFVDQFLSMWNLAKNCLPIQFLVIFIIYPPEPMLWKSLEFNLFLLKKTTFDVVFTCLNKWLLNRGLCQHLNFGLFLQTFWRGGGQMTFVC